MIPYVENGYFYTRKNSILIACLTDGAQVPLVKFKEKFIDLIIVEGQAFEYMKKYMEIHPNSWEYVKEELKIGEQISLF